MKRRHEVHHVVHPNGMRVRVGTAQEALDGQFKASYGRIRLVKVVMPLLLTREMAEDMGLVLAPHTFSLTPHE